MFINLAQGQSERVVFALPTKVEVEKGKGNFKLTETNWYSWSFSMKSNLMSKDLWKVVEHPSLRKYLESVLLEDEEVSEELTFPPLAKEPTA